MRLILFPVLLLTTICANTPTTAALAIDVAQNGTIRVISSESFPERVAVDVSNDLGSWRELAIVAGGGSQITFADQAAAGAGARFFRLSDADNTFLVAGTVEPLVEFAFDQPLPWFQINPPPGLPPQPPFQTFDPGVWAGATVSIPSLGLMTQSEADGSFRFNQRLLRADLPIEVISSIYQFVSATNVIASTNVDLRVVARPLFASGPIWYDAFLTETPLPVARHHFKITSGPDATAEFDIITAERLELPYTNPAEAAAYHVPLAFAQGLTNKLGLSTSFTNEIRAWISATNRYTGVFSLPTVTEIPDNGTVSIEPLFTPANAPNIETLTLRYDSLASQASFTLNLSTNGQFSTSESPARMGTYSFAGLNLNLSFQGSPAPEALTLYLPDRTTTNGYFLSRIGTNAQSAGTFYFVPRPPAQPVEFSFSLTQSPLGAAYYAVRLNYATHLFTAMDGAVGYGTFTFTIISPTEARLRLDYGGEFAGDFDDYTLSYPGNPSGANQLNGVIFANPVTGPATGTYRYKLE